MLPIVILVTTGASHSFISPQVATALGMKVREERVMGVRLGDGNQVSTLGKCEKVEVQIGEFSTQVDAYVLELGNLDMVLGVTWLRRFWKITLEWENMTLSFNWQGRVVE